MRAFINAKAFPLSFPSRNLLGLELFSSLPTMGEVEKPIRCVHLEEAELSIACAAR